MAGPTNSAVRRSAIRWNDRVRLVFADVDETIAPLYAPASAAMLASGAKKEIILGDEELLIRHYHKVAESYLNA